MNLSEEQKQAVAAWLKQGLKLSDIQQRLESDYGLRLTYLETRLLVADLKLVPRDQEAPKAVPAPLEGPGTPGKRGPSPAQPETERGAPTGAVSVVVDTVARPGALISGRVHFSDGQKADWYLDQLGRLAMIPQQQNYRPSPADMQAFQNQLETELQKLGF